MIVFNVADYIDCPEGPKRTDSENSAEMLREDFLVPALMKRKENEEFVIVIDDSNDDSFSYGSNYLKEAFIGLVRYNHISLYELQTIRWENKTSQGKFYIDRIFKYIEEYREEIKEEHELIKQLKTIKRKMNKNTLTIAEYRRHSVGYEAEQRKIKACKTLLPIVKTFQRDKNVFIIENSRIRFDKIEFVRVYNEEKDESFIANQNKMNFFTTQGQEKRKIGYKFLNVPIFKGTYHVLDRQISRYYDFYPESLRFDVVHEILRTMSNDEIEEMAKMQLKSITHEETNEYKKAIEKLLTYNFELQSFSYQVRDRYIEEMSKEKFDKMFESENFDYFDFEQRLKDYNDEKSKHKIFIQNIFG